MMMMSDCDSDDMSNKSNKSNSSNSTFQYHNHVLAASTSLLNMVGHAHVAIVLGSGLNGFVARLEDTRECHYSRIPYMPQTSVSGHDGKCVTGTLEGADGRIRIMCFAGRVHMYEGWRSFEINFMSRVCHAAGVKLFILTNSAGGCLPGMTPGSIMMIRDHMRFTNMNPLLDVCEDRRFGPRILDCSQGVFSNEVAELARQAATEQGIQLDEGTYCWTSGPCYETRAEVQAGIKLSAGAFGMSTVPEILSAHACGMVLFGISLATNLAAGLLDEKLLHADVKRVAAEAGPKFERLLLATIKRFKVADIDKWFASKGESQSSVTSAGAPIGDFVLVEPRVPWTPTIDEVNVAACAILEANFGEPSPTVALFTTVGQHDLPDQLFASASHTRCMSLLDMPGMRVNAVSKSARHGALLLGTTDAGVRVAIVTNQALEGLPSDEASLIVQALSVVGVHTVLACFLGTASVSSAHDADDGAEKSRQSRSPSLVIANDTMDRSTSRTAPISDRSSVGKRVDGASAFDMDLRKAAHAAISGSGGSNDAEGAYMCIPGPVLPTRAEIRAGRLGSCAAVVGVTSPAPLSAARAAGMRLFAVCAVFDNMVGATAASGIASMDACIASVVEKSGGGNGDCDERKESTLPQPRANPPQDSNVLSMRPLGSKHQQEPLEQTRAVAIFLEEKLGIKRGRTSALVLCEGSLCSAVNKSAFVETASVLSADVPNMSTDAWRISSGTWNDKEVLVVWDASPHPVDMVEEIGAFVGGLGIIVRACQQLGINHLMASVPVCSADSELKVDDTVMFDDHVNLTGRHPLFGPNVDEYGTRFPDMSNVYDRKFFASLKKNHDMAVVAANLNNSAFDSAAEAMFARALGCRVLTSGELVNLVLIANHMEMRTLVVGVVVQTTTNAELLHRPVAASVQQIEKVRTTFEQCLSCCIASD